MSGESDALWSGDCSSLASCRGHQAEQKHVFKAAVAGLAVYLVRTVWQWNGWRKL